MPLNDKSASTSAILQPLFILLPTRLANWLFSKEDGLVFPGLFAACEHTGPYENPPIERQCNETHQTLLEKEEEWKHNGVGELAESTLYICMELS
jgi:hypothetical protein